MVRTKEVPSILSHNVIMPIILIPVKYPGGLPVPLIQSTWHLSDKYQFLSHTEPPLCNHAYSGGDLSSCPIRLGCGRVAWSQLEERCL